jgi:glutathione transport system permease protein
MFRYILTKLMTLVPLVLCIIVSVSALNQLVPGDVVDRILGVYATDEQKENLRQELGLNQNIAMQIVSYTNNLLHADLGTSLIYNRSVLGLILERLQASLELAFLSIMLALLVGCFLGLCAATSSSKFVKDSILLLSVGATAVPNFLLASVFIWIFSVKYDLFPVSGKGSLSTYVLPSITLGLSLASIISRVSYNAIYENIKTDFFLTAKAKGLPYWKIIFKHVLKNASISIATIASLQFGSLVTGAIITERIFDWPGLGSLIVEALGNRDEPLIKGCILFFAFSYLIVNLLTDVFYAYVDPRIRFGKSITQDS